jgi:PPP family 3-phenylpropionic acid transporter
MTALPALAPAGARGRAQGLLSATLALAMAATTMLSGIAFRAAGAWVFAFMVPIAGLGLVLALRAREAVPLSPTEQARGGE